MTTNPLRAAPVVTLVLAFVVVFGLGRLTGASQPPVTPPALPSVQVSEPQAAPGSDDAADKTDTDEVPVPDGGTGQSQAEQAPPTAFGVPDAADHVSLGTVAPMAPYEPEPLHPTVRQTKDGRWLKVCVRVPPGRGIDGEGVEWRQDDPPDGDHYCVYVTPGTAVEFRLVTQ
jgi:hypothetical protein